MLKSKAQASIEVMISILIVIFLFTIVFLVSIMKSNDTKDTEEFLTHREACLKTSSLLFLASVFDYVPELSINFNHELSRDNGLIKVYQIFCYGYTRRLDKIFYNIEQGKFRIINSGEEIRFDKQ